MSDPVGHKSVLVAELLDYLNPQPGKVYVDATFGVGGHTRAILEREPTCTVIALDWDENAITDYGEPLQEEFGSRLHLIWGSFAHLYKLLKKAGFAKVDGICADFGTSQVQIKTQAGFSFTHDTPLDMRMSRAHFTTTAADIVNDASERDLCDIFWTYGGEGRARAIVRRIVEFRKKQRIETTAQLADIVQKAVPEKRHHRIHPATKVFQALRICVNKELENITSFLSAACSVVNPGGRIVCISFHSLEDRLVKNFFKDRQYLGDITVVTSKVIVAGEEEVTENPSSRSAKLRAAEIIKKRL